MAMEYFTLPWMHLFFGENAEKQKKAYLWDSLEAMPYMACVDEFQHRVYAENLTDAMERRKVWHELEEIYLPWRDYDGNDSGCRNSTYSCARSIILITPYPV